MLPFLADHFGNPSSTSHAYGWAARRAVEHARGEVAALLGAAAAEIIWTSGATEGNNLAIKGAARANRRGRAGHLVTFASEHRSVLDAMGALERSDGFSVTCLPVTAGGRADLDQLAEALRPDTVLVSVMLVNNEIGVIQPVAEIAALCRERGILLHCDAVQAAGKLPIDVGTLGADLLTVTAHKMYGPKGIGALYVKGGSRLRLEPLIHGGGQEAGLRSGTLAVHQIAGFGEAARIARAEMPADNQRIGRLRKRLLEQLQGVAGITLNGDPVERVPHNLNLAFALPPGLSLIDALEDVAVSSGSACASGAAEPSHVLRAIGCPDELAHNSIRFTLGRQTTEEEIDVAAEALKREVARLRAAGSAQGAGVGTGGIPALKAGAGRVTAVPAGKD